MNIQEWCERAAECLRRGDRDIILCEDVPLLEIDYLGRKKISDCTRYPIAQTALTLLKRVDAAYEGQK